jgi:phosphopantetheinyl transferase
MQAPYLMQSCEVQARYAPWAELDARSALAELSLCEEQQLEQSRHPQRRREWLAGRTLAKQLVAGTCGADLAPQEIEILHSEESRRPRVWIRGRAEPRSLSIAHSSRGVLVALGSRAEILVGADLAEQTPLSASFKRLWFTADERQWLCERSESFAANRLWAAKEALYKACNQGEGFDPRKISAVPGSYRYRGRPVSCPMEVFEIDHQFAVIATLMKTNTRSSRQLLQEIHS